MKELYCWLTFFFFCVVAPLNAQKSAQEVKLVRDAMKQYAQVYEFVEEYAKAAENVLQDTNAFAGFFSKSATVPIDHPYWYYEPRIGAQGGTVAEYCRFFSKYHNRCQMFVTGITVRNIEVEKCAIEGQDMVFEIAMDKLIGFRDEALEYSRRDTCREILYVRNKDGDLRIEKVTLKESTFHSVQSKMWEAVARITPAEISIEDSPKLSKQMNTLMKIVKEVANKKNKPRKRK